MDEAMNEMEPVALREVLHAAAGVLQDLEGRCGRLQSALSPTLAGNPHAVALQDLDYVTQGLASLSWFLSNLGQELPDEWRADAAAATRDLPLEAMAAALRLQPQEASAAAGDLELFE